MKTFVKFGENAEGYNIPVLNEREIRASAGLLFLFMFLSLMLIIFKQNFVLIKYVITLFLTDFLIRVVINPKYAPTLIIGRIIVRNQVPEYVGAAPKKFAWIIGIVLATLMFILMVLMNSYSVITGITCLICLTFLFFESSFGICLGCKFYPLFFKEDVKYCPGEVCEIKDRKEILKISGAQIVILLVFIVYIFFTSVMFNDFFRKDPHDLFNSYTSEQSK